MATATEKRAAVVTGYKSRLGKNIYTQDTSDPQGRTRNKFWGNPEGTNPGWSDCSESVRRALMRFAGVDPGFNTNAQVSNRKRAVIVEMTDWYYPNEALLKPGDLLYFKGNPAHIMDVGHVEMYTGPNECCGHGSAKGPTKKNLHNYCKSRASATKRYFLALRWIPDDATDGAYPLLVSGMINNDVGKMQELLLTHGLMLPTWGADKEFGEETKTALMAFQHSKNLPMTGECNEATWKALLDTTDDPEPDGVNPYEAIPEDKCYGRGAIGNDVKWIQWELIDAGYAVGPDGIDGEFGKKTQAAVMNFQQKVFPTQMDEWDGVVGPNTRKALLAVHDDISD